MYIIIGQTVGDVWTYSVTVVVSVCEGADVRAGSQVSPFLLQLATAVISLGGQTG